MPMFKKSILALAVFCLFFSAAWHFWISKYFLSLEKDFTYEAELISVNNFYDQEKEAYSGQQYSRSFFKYTVLETTKSGFLIENQLQSFDSEENEISLIKREYGINPRTGEHISGLGDKNRDGYLFAPNNLEPGKEFTYWHINYDAPAQMHYLKREKLFGQEVYSYETRYENGVIFQNDEFDLIFEPHLKIWVEPLTGFLIKYEDQTTAYYYDLESGEKLKPWNHFSNTFTEESVKAKIKDAQLAKIKILVHEKAIPLAALILSAFFLVFSLTKKLTPSEHNYGIHWPIHAFFILFPISLILICWHLAESKINSKNELEFKNRVTEIEEAILRRTDIATNTLEGLQGFFKASQEVSQEEWRVYIDQLDLEEKYPGVKVVAYAPIIWQADLATHINEIKNNGFANYEIHPEGLRELYTPVIYVEPASEENLEMIGFDAFSEEVHRETMSFARDTGAAGMSAKFLISEENPASIIYIPIYANSLSVSSIEEKRSAIQGYAFAAFQIDEFIEGLFGTTPLGVNFTIYDGTETSNENILYEYIDNQNEEETGLRKTTETIHLAGRAWTIKFTGLEEFRASDSQKWATWGILWFAMLLCLLHIFIYFTLIASRDRAMEWIAERSPRFSSKGSKRKTRKESIKR